MSWIESIDYADAEANLKRVYDRVKGPDNNVDNVLAIHSQRPHTLIGHMTLYKAVLHNANNTLPKWFLEAIGTYVSYLNECQYCVEHHFAGLSRLLGNQSRAQAFFQAMESDQMETFFDAGYFSGILYAKKLTLAHTTIQPSDIDQMKSAGFTEGEILEINQVVSYFNYVNRTALGLGVTTAGDDLGLSPHNSDDTEDWNHQ